MEGDVGRGWRRPSLRRVPHMRRARSACCWLALALLGAAPVVSGCGGTAEGTVTATDPAKAFAPVVHLSESEPFMPMSARWFLGRSALWWAPGEGCAHDKAAVGRLLRNQRTVVVNWIFIIALGWGPAYWREAYADPSCTRAREAYRYYANQLNRPYDTTPGRAPGLKEDEGYYLDLMDWARAGRSAEQEDGQATVAVGESLFERNEVEIDGEPGLRLRYWMLYGANRPSGADGDPVRQLTHEGDWEWVDVTLREGDDEDAWEPVSIHIPGGDGRPRTVDWDAVKRTVGPGAEGATHPTLFAARGTHTLYAAPGSRPQDIDGVATEDVASAPCAQCPRWQMWSGLSDARTSAWYGFGGAWGDMESNDLTTGPLGPHGATWPAGDPAEQLKWAKRRP